VKYTILLIIAAMTALSLNTHADVVAEYTPSNPVTLFGIGGGSSFQAGQTFAPTESGQLADVAILLSENGGQPTSVFVDLRPTQSGVPTSTILGTATIPGNLLSSTPTLLSADFTSLDIPLSVGTEYAFTLTTSANGGAYVDGGDQNGYAAGGAFTSDDSGGTWSSSGLGSFDVGFQVTAVVPEPTSMALVIVGGAGLIFRRRGRKKA
jgi:PEP-CTERM motif-containing protein